MIAEWMDGSMDGLTHLWMDGWTGGRIDGWTNGIMDGTIMDVQTDRLIKLLKMDG